MEVVCLEAWVGGIYSMRVSRETVIRGAGSVRAMFWNEAGSRSSGVYGAATLGSADAADLVPIMPRQSNGGRSAGGTGLLMLSNFLATVCCVGRPGRTAVSYSRIEEHG
jgi:hypothetical protein